MENQNLPAKLRTNVDKSPLLLALSVNGLFSQNHRTQDTEQYVGCEQFGIRGVLRAVSVVGSF
jgi:hypothetical protein